MPGDLKLTLRLTADGKGFVGEVRGAEKGLEKLMGATLITTKGNRFSIQKHPQCCRCAGF